MGGPGDGVSPLVLAKPPGQPQNAGTSAGHKRVSHPSPPCASPSLAAQAAAPRIKQSPLTTSHPSPGMILHLKIQRSSPKQAIPTVPFDGGPWARLYPPNPPFSPSSKAKTPPYLLGGRRRAAGGRWDWRPFQRLGRAAYFRFPGPAGEEEEEELAGRRRGSQRGFPGRDRCAVLGRGRVVPSYLPAPVLPLPGSAGGIGECRH